MARMAMATALLKEGGQDNIVSRPILHEQFALDRRFGSA